MAQGTTRGVPIDIDPLLAADSNLLVPSQKAIKTYVDAGLLTKQGTLTLTTTGTSGAATLVGNTLNIPQYSGGGGGTPGGATGNVQFNSAGTFAGSNNLFWDNTNNRLGIGTASPTNDLTLSKSVNGNTDILNFNSSTGTSALTRFIVRNDTNNEGQLFASGSNWSGYGSMTGNAVGFYSSLLNGIQIAADGNFTQTRIQFMTGTTPSTKMVIQNNGNVQIGTTTDAGYRLDVNGTARAVTSLQTPTLLGNTTSGGTLTLSSTSNATKGKILFGTSAYDEVNNRLGIGTASPLYSSHITGNVGTGDRAVQSRVINTNSNGEAVLFLGNDNSQGGLELFGSTYGGGVSNKLSFTSQTISGFDIILFNNSVGADFAIKTTTSLTERLKLFGNTGNVFIGNSPTDAGYKLDVNGTARIQGALNFNPTNTAAGTTGNQTINKPSGTVNIAAAGTTITVTNSLVTANSIVFATIRTNDATAVIKNVVPAAGSFTINLNAAATAETSIGFFVIN